MSAPRDAALVTALEALARTWRVEVTGAEHLGAVAGGPFIFALWHRTLIPLLWWHRRRGIAILVSRHRDGELVASAAGRLGYRTVRGSSTRGGAAGYRGILRAVADGVAVAITPDGPAGPGGVVKPGIVHAARRTSVPILPVAAAADSAWHLRSWDRLLLPRPFAAVRIAYGPPVVVPVGGEAEAGRVLADRLDGLLSARLVAA